MHAGDDGVDDREARRRADSSIGQTAARANDAANGCRVLERAYDRRPDRDDSPSAGLGSAHPNGSRARNEVRLIER